MQNDKLPKITASIVIICVTVLMTITIIGATYKSFKFFFM